MHAAAAVLRDLLGVLTYVRLTEQLRPWYRLDAVGARLHSTVCMANCGLPAAFAWVHKAMSLSAAVLGDVW